MERRNIFANNLEKSNELVEMYNSGKYNTEDLGQYFGTSRSTIRGNLIKLGITIERRNTKKHYILDVNIDRTIEMYNDNISISQIAKQMCVDRSVIESRLIDSGFDLSHIRQEKKYSGVESCYYKLYKKYKASSEYRGYKFDLDEQVFFKLLQGDCMYCGDEPKQIVKHNGYEVLYNGIDRIDNIKGYTEDNCVSCCWVCNRFKQGLSEQEMSEHVLKMYNHLF